ncbi:MAG: Coenzyme F420 hydrogenase/dehydrogenase, beta subunit C-terminal domain [Pseudomonadota bacterium]
MQDIDVNGQCRLIETVIKKGICVNCGACVGICPYFDYFNGKVINLDRCYSETWRCLQLCPRADFDGISIDNGPPMEEEGVGTPIGPFKDIFISRSTEKNILEKAQYGGVVSSLLIFGLKSGWILSAILTDQGDEFSPAGRIARDESEVLHCAGSRYTASGSLSALNRAIRENEEKIGVVGVPCQMEAIARMGLMTPDGGERSERIGIKIGLFCTWALDYRKLKAHLNRLNLGGAIRKYDIPPPPSQVFQILTETGWVDLPLDRVRPFIQKGCSLCQDMTAEWADISVGTVEGMEGWNTLVVRNPLGSRFIMDAINSGIIEIDDIPNPNFEHLKEASLTKKRRGVSAKDKMRTENNG